MKRAGTAAGVRSRTPFFAALDGMRGIAAVLIIQRHAPDFFGSEIGSTHLGLDMFFCLSGFVVPNAYEQRLQSGSLTFSNFLLLRLIRFLPLYLTATAIMAIGAIAVGRDISVVLASAVLSALFIPTPEALSGIPSIFPLLFVAWSLFWELLICIAYGLIARRLTMPLLVAILLVSFCALVATAMTFGSLNAGFNWPSFWAGGSRITFAFFAGVLCFRLRPRFTSGNTIGCACVAVLALIIMTPASLDWRVPFDVLVVAIALPALTWFASSSEMTGRAAAVFTALGAISYPLYLLHIPVFRIAVTTLEPQGGGAAIQGAILVALLLPFCWAVDRYLDQPARKAIVHRLAQNAVMLSSRITPHKASAL